MRLDVSNEKLRSSATALSEVLQSYGQKHPDAPFLSNDAFLSALTGSSSNPLDGDMFGQTVEQVLVSRADQKLSVAHKVGSYMGKLYPLTSLTLSLAMTGAEVSILACTESLHLMFT